MTATSTDHFSGEKRAHRKKPKKLMYPCVFNLEFNPVSSSSSLGWFSLILIFFFWLFSAGLAFPPLPAPSETLWRFYLCLVPAPPARARGYQLCVGAPGHAQPVGDFRDHRLIFGISQLSKKLTSFSFVYSPPLLIITAIEKITSVYSQITFNLMNKLSHYHQGKRRLTNIVIMLLFSELMI